MSEFALTTDALDKDELAIRRRFLFRLLAEEEQRAQLAVQKTVRDLRQRHGPDEVTQVARDGAVQAALCHDAMHSMRPARRRPRGFHWPHFSPASVAPALRSP